MQTCSEIYIVFSSNLRITPGILSFCVIAAGLTACGDAKQDLQTAGDNTRHVTSDVLDDVGDGAKDAAGGADDACHRAGDKAAEGLQKTHKAALDSCEEVQKHGDSAADTVASMASDVADQAREAASAASTWASNLERPILEQREEKCAQEHGYWAETVDVTPCENGYATVTVDGSSNKQACEGDGQGQQAVKQCVHQTKTGAYYFNDGPSTPHYLQRFGELISDRTHFLRWNDLFWEAAVNHDYCYHHGQITYGYAQKDCDEQFIDDLLAVCRSGRGEVHAWFDSEVCMQNAQGMYGAVRQFGGDSFDVMNTRVAYPEYTPMFDKLNVMRERDDQERREYIESWLP